MSTASSSRTDTGNIKGFRCTACAAGLLQKRADREAQEWAEEEAELQADDMDVTDLQKRRLATFGSVKAG
ncbi:MAG TPA: hypothetical protein VNY29_16600 [Terriglobales bacterium]|jgi:hypothetical protein|nr:hypothetical protein [Terriglobales bacterium]